MNCKNCGAPLNLKRNTCEYCGSPHSSLSGDSFNIDYNSKLHMLELFTVNEARKFFDMRRVYINEAGEVVYVN